MKRMIIIFAFLCFIAKVSWSNETDAEGEVGFRWATSAFAAGVAIPTILYGYKSESRLIVIAGSTLVPTLGYLLARPSYAGLPTSKTGFILATTGMVWLTYVIGNAGMGVSEKTAETTERRASQIMDFGYYVLGASTIIDFYLIGEKGKDRRMTLDVAPNAARIAYRF